MLFPEDPLAVTGGRPAPPPTGPTGPVEPVQRGSSARQEPASLTDDPFRSPPLADDGKAAASKKTEAVRFVSDRSLSLSTTNPGSGTDDCSSGRASFLDDTLVIPSWIGHGSPRTTKRQYSSASSSRASATSLLHDDDEEEDILSQVPESRLLPPHSVAPLYSSGQHIKPVRAVEIVVQNLDCAVAEKALRTVLNGTPGISWYSLNAATATLLIEYHLEKTSAFVIVGILHCASFTPVWYRLHSSRSGAVRPRGVAHRNDGQDLTQLVLRIGPDQYRTDAARRAIQHHVLAHDGIKSCQVACFKAELTVTYDSRVVGARAIVSYVQAAGVDMDHGTEPSSAGAISPHSVAVDASRFWKPNVGGFKLVTSLSLVSLWLSATPPPVLRGCLFGRVPAFLLVEMAVALCTVTSVGAPTVVAGWQHFRYGKGVPSAASAVSMAGFGLFFLSLIDAIVMMLHSLPRFASDNPAGYCSYVADSALATVRFDIVTMIFLVWTVGISLTRNLRLRLRRSIEQEEATLMASSRARVVDGTGAIQYLPKVLVQKSDVLLLKPGEVALFDGRAMTSAVVKQSLLLCPTDHVRPYRVQENQMVYAGTRVMSGDLKVRVRQVGEPLMSRVLTMLNTYSIQMSSLPSTFYKWIWPYCSVTHFVVGCVLGALQYCLQVPISLWDLAAWVSGTPVISSSPVYQFTLLQAFVTAASIWMCGSTSTLLAAVTATRTAAAHYLGSLGLFLHDDATLGTAASARHVIVSRSALLSNQLDPSCRLVLCYSRCIQTMRVLHIAPNSEENTGECGGSASHTRLWDTVFLDLPTQTNDSTQQMAVKLLWTLVWRLETSCYAHQMRSGVPVTALTRLARVLLRQARKLFGTQLSADIVDTSGIAPSHWSLPMNTRVHPGKGVEVSLQVGTASQQATTERALDGQNLGLANHTHTIAAGSLEFITACHQYGIEHGNGSERELGKRLRVWAEKCLAAGEEVVLVAIDGIPIGGVTVRSQFLPCVRPALEHIQTQLGALVWLCTSGSFQGARALSSETGVPIDRIIAGACPNEKIRFMERLVTTQPDNSDSSFGVFDQLPGNSKGSGQEKNSCSIVLATTSTELLACAASSSQLTGRYCGMLVRAATLDLRLPGVTVASRGKCVTSLLNLIRVSREAIRWERISFTATFIGALLLDISLLNLLPSTAWAFIPLIAIVGVFANTLLALLLAQVPPSIPSVTIQKSGRPWSCHPSSVVAVECESDEDSDSLCSWAIDASPATATGRRNFHEDKRGDNVNDGVCQDISSPSYRLVIPKVTTSSVFLYRCCARTLNMGLLRIPWRLIKILCGCQEKKNVRQLAQQLADTESGKIYIS